MKYLIISAALIILFSSYNSKDGNPFLAELNVSSCKGASDVPQAVLSSKYSENTLKLLFAFERNCSSNDTVSFALSGETLNIKVYRNRRLKQYDADCDCVFKYDLVIKNIAKLPKIINVNGKQHVDRLGFCEPYLIDDNLNFLNTIEKLGKYPLNKYFYLPVYDPKSTSASKYPLDFVKYLELNPFTMIEVQGIVTKEESIDQTLPYVRAKYFRSLLAVKNDVAINRIVLTDSVNSLGKKSIRKKPGLRIKLTQASNYGRRPHYK